MNDVNSEYYSSDQSPTTPVVSSVPKDTFNRPCDTLKTMNPTPNGYSNIPNHKPKGDDQEVKKHHDPGKHSEHHKHSSDHVKKKESDPTKPSSHSSSKPRDSSSKDSSSNSSKESNHKEKKHHSSSHKDRESSKSKEGKHSDSSKKHSSSNSEKKHHSSEVKSDSVKKEHSSGSIEKSKSDNFKENEKVKDGSSKESKHKDKEKHKEKHKDKSHKDKSSSKLKDGESKDKSDKAKSDSDKAKEKHKEHKDKHKEHSKDKHGEKHKSDEKSKSAIKHDHSIKIKDGDKPDQSVKIKEEKNKDSDKHEQSAKIKEEKNKDSDKHKLGDKQKKDKSVKIKVKTEEAFSSPTANGASLKIKDEPMSEDDMPLSKSSVNKKSVKRESESDEDEKPKKKKVKSEKKRKAGSDDECDSDYGAKKPAKKVKKEKPTPKGKVKQEPEPVSPKKRVKKEKEEEQDVWKWWEEEKHEDGIKWKTLQHNGPVFAPPYERVPKNIKFYYDGKHMPLSESAEEVAGFYGRMLDHDYTSKESFNTNFFKDWRKVMTPEEKEAIKDLSKCNFKDYDVYYKQKSEERKAMTKEQKLEIKKENERLTAEYGFCIIDGHKQKIGNFKIEPPGLFRGRGEHPKMGMLKRRIVAEDILINIGREAKIPEPPPGHKWKEVRHDNTVSWLASWTENILGSTKYIMLNPSSKLKGEKDWQKYETARKLKAHAHRIREEYTRDFKSKEMKVRQRAVALYFIDKLALRAGNEKDEDTADTVGCCSLRVEHITLDDEKDGQEYVVSFDFLGKDSIRYFNSVAVEKRAYKNLKLFMENKQPGDDLFDRLNTTILNKYLLDLMEGLTAKVFRTYNASNTLQQQLDLLTKEDMSLPEKILAYNRANREVAILCNHQRAVPKGFSKSMEGLNAKIEDKKQQIKECKKELKELKSAAKNGSSKDQLLYDKKKKRLAQLEDQLKRLEIQATDREENKQIALGTSKLNYLDPRISVAWCKKWDVPIEKIYNKTQRDKFRWAIEMAGPDYKF